MINITSSILKKIYKKRSKWCHKDDFGRLIIIGGSKKYSGSPTLAGLAALASIKSGVDIVEIVSPERAADIIATFSPDLITYPLDGNYLGKKHLDKLLDLSKNKEAFVIGGGLERGKETLNTIREYLRNVKIPGVIDADAIYALDKSINLENFVITPHAYEFYVMTGIAPSEQLRERIEQVKKAAKKLRTIILLKGHVDIISDGAKTIINRTGSVYMTKGGTGDTLAGIIGSLIAQGNTLFDSACAGAYINGRAGEMTRKKSSLMAQDLINEIGKIVDKASK